MGEIACPNCGGLEWTYLDDMGDHHLVECWGCGVNHKLWKKI